MTHIGGILCVIGMACAVWFAYGWLLLPVPCPVRAVISASGAGEGLEQTVRGLLWLQRTGLWHGDIAIRDEGLSHVGVTLALTLARKDGIEFYGRASR